METVTWTITSLLSDVSAIFSTASGLIMGSVVASAFVGISLASRGIGLFKNVIKIR